MLSAKVLLLVLPIIHFTKPTVLESGRRCFTNQHLSFHQFEFHLATLCRYFDEVNTGRNVQVKLVYLCTDFLIPKYQLPIDAVDFNSGMGDRSKIYVYRTIGWIGKYFLQKQAWAQTFHTC